MDKPEFLICEKCGNLVGLIHDAGVPMWCCKQQMTELKANSTEASGEKHLPVVNVEGDTVRVCVGSDMHPMGEDHYIQWVYLLTDRGGHRKIFKPGDKPELLFNVAGEKPLSAYAYCNNHGLWKTDIIS